MQLPERRASFGAAADAEANLQPACGLRGAMEVVEAAEQLQTLKFGGSGQGPAASPAPEERRDSEQADRAPLAGQQPPPAAQSANAAAGSPPPSEACVTDRDSAEPPPALQASDSSDSDSDSDRSSACEPRGCQHRGGAGAVVGARALRTLRAHVRFERGYSASPHCFPTVSAQL